MNIKLIGADSSNGMKILKNLRKVEKELDYTLNIETIMGKDKRDFDVKEIPTLFINDKIVSTGKVLSDRELYKILKLSTI